MNHDATIIVDTAIAWHLRQATMAAEDWPAFVDWLEADPAHACAYEAILAQDRLIGEAAFPVEVVPVVAANDNSPRRWWALAGGGAIAAALALWMVPVGTKAQVYTTRDGEHRDVTLPDGTQVAMNGGSVLRFDPADPRNVTLERGEATLQVVHDDAHPFTLRSGDAVVQDMGTTFDVTRNGDALSVAVEEGSVLFQPDGAAVRLGAGQALTARGGRIERSTVAPEAVGGWRNGTLAFDAAPIADVAVSLRRLHGIDVRVGDGLSTRPFTGMIHVTGAADRDVPHLADLIGATWRRDGKAWVLAERANPVR